jgi:hypothetical protein
MIIAFLFATSTVFGITSCQPVIPPDSTNEITVPYRTRNNYYVIPVLINDSLSVNLLLDPHCKSVILFGKRYQKLLERKRKNVERLNTSGTKRTPLKSLNNKISIGPALGENISIVVLPNSNPFNFFTSVNGVMGYDILSDCEIIINKKEETMTIRINNQKNFTASVFGFK